MAIRYSGDTEIRFGWDKNKKIYRGTVRDPYKKWNGYCKIIWIGDPTDSSAYDRAAIKLIKLAEYKVGKFELEREYGQIKIRRIFQSPCPKKMVE